MTKPAGYHHVAVEALEVALVKIQQAQRTCTTADGRFMGLQAARDLVLAEVVYHQRIVDLDREPDPPTFDEALGASLDNARGYFGR